MSCVLFIVTSVIHTGMTPWSYTRTRSLFPPDVRLRQTRETLASIRRHCDGAKIVLVEGGALTEEERAVLVAESDLFVDAHALGGTRQNCLESGKKGLGDAWLLLTGLEFIRGSIPEQPRLIFKVSGRYRLNDQFRIENISNSAPTFTRFSHAGCITFCFAVPGHMLESFIDIMKGTVAMYCGSQNPSLETYLPEQFSSIHEIPCMGAEGQIAVDTLFATYRV